MPLHPLTRTAASSTRGGFPLWRGFLCSVPTRRLICANGAACYGLPVGPTAHAQWSRTSPTRAGIGDRAAVLRLCLNQSRSTATRRGKHDLTPLTCANAGISSPRPRDPATSPCSTTTRLLIRQYEVAATAATALIAQCRVKALPRSTQPAQPQRGLRRTFRGHRRTFQMSTKWASNVPLHALDSEACANSDPPRPAPTPRQANLNPRPGASLAH